MGNFLGHCSFCKQFVLGEIVTTVSRMVCHRVATVTWEIFSVLIFLVDKWSIRQRWNIYPNFQALHPWTSICEVHSRTLQDLGHNTGMRCVTIPPQDYKKYATMLYVVIINIELALMVDNSGMCDHRRNSDSNIVGWGGSIDRGCCLFVFVVTAPH